MSLMDSKRNQFDTINVAGTLQVAQALLRHVPRARMLFVSSAQVYGMRNRPGARRETDEKLLGEVLCAMLEGQFEAHKVTDDDVRSSFDGQTLLAAQKAFYEELIAFFRSRGRNDRAKAVAKQMALIEAAVAAVETRIDALDIDATIRGAMTPGETSGASPEASASIPGP